MHYNFYRFLQRGWNPQFTLCRYVKYWNQTARGAAGCMPMTVRFHEVYCPLPGAKYIHEKRKAKILTQSVRANANPAILYKITSHLLREGHISDTGLITQKCRWQLYTPKTSY